MIFILNESLPDLGWDEGDIITWTTLQTIMVTYAQVSVTVVQPQ